MHFAISAGTQQQSSRDHYIQAIRQARPARSRHHQHAVSVDQISAPFTPDTGNDAEFANWSPKPSTAMSKPTTHAFSTRGTFGSSAGHQCETTLRYSRVRPSGWVHPDLGEYRDLDKNLPLTPMSSALGLYLPPSPERMRKDSPQASPPALRKTKSGYSLAATFMTTSSNFDVVGGEEISPDGQRATSQIRQLSSETTRTYLAPSALPATAIKRAAWPNLTLETFDRSQPLQPGLPPRPRSRLYSAEPSGMPTRPTVRHDSFGSKSLPAMSILSCKRKAPPLISPGLLAEISTSREQDYFGKDVAKLDANLRDWPACTSCSRQKYLAGQRVLEREHLGQQVTKEGGNGHG